jgi:hypothetical protein
MAIEDRDNSGTSWGMLDPGQSTIGMIGDGSYDIILDKRTATSALRGNRSHSSFHADDIGHKTSDYAGNLKSVRRALLGSGTGHRQNVSAKIELAKDHNENAGMTRAIVQDFAVTDIKIDEHSHSNMSLDGENSGLKHSTELARIGSGVALFDPTSSGTISGKSNLTNSDVTIGTVANTNLASESHEYVETTTHIKRSGSMAPGGPYSPGFDFYTTTGTNSDGSIAFVKTSHVVEGGWSIANTYDDNGDGMVDRYQSITVSIDANGVRTETIVNTSDGGGTSRTQTIAGDANANTLAGGAGNDILTGGAGVDTFVYTPAFGFDAITDFTARAGATHDTLQLALGSQFSSLAQVIAASTQVGANTVITIDATDTITLNNVNKTALVASNFVFM